MKAVRLAILACALAAPILIANTTAQAQDDAKRQIAARTELHAIPSLTLTDQQFLAGDAGGSAVTVTGELRVAQGTGRLPVVVLVHGSGGIGPNIEMWARELNAIGISTFALDGFTGRGLVSVNMDQARLGRLAFTLDAYRVLDILAKHPRVDPARIALMGFSRGGQGALFASLKRFHQAWNKSGIEFAAYIPFYPDCFDHLSVRHRRGGQADPDFPWHAGRLQSGRDLPEIRRGRRPPDATCNSPNIRMPSMASTIRLAAPSPSW